MELTGSEISRSSLSRYGRSGGRRRTCGGARQSARLPERSPGREKARDAATKKAKGRAEIKAALDAFGGKLTPPWLPVLVVDEPTVEGLAMLFAVSRPALGVFSSEGGQFVGGHGMQDDAKLRTAAGRSALRDRAAIKRVRADGTTILPDRWLSVHLMAQPAGAAS